MAPLSLLLLSVLVVYGQLVSYCSFVIQSNELRPLIIVMLLRKVVTTVSGPLFGAEAARPGSHGLGQ